MDENQNNSQPNNFTPEPGQAPNQPPVAQSFPAQGNAMPPTNQVVPPTNNPPQAAQPQSNPEYYAASMNHGAPRKSKKGLMWGLLALIIIIVGLGAFVFFKYIHKTSYQSVAREFVTAMQQHDKSKVDALTSPKAKALYQKYYKTDSIYTFCQNSGTLCTNDFSQKFLNSATETSKSQTFPGGIKGEQVLYSVKQSTTGQVAGTNVCSGSVQSTLSIELIPSGNSWLVYSAGPSAGLSANGC